MSNPFAFGALAKLKLGLRFYRLLARRIGRGAALGLMLRAKSRTARALRTLDGVTPQNRDLAESIVFNAQCYALLQTDHSPEQALAILGDVVQDIGIELMQRSFEGSMTENTFSAFAAFCQTTLAQSQELGIYELKVVQDTEERFGFNMTFCFYDTLCRRLGVPELAQMYCNVDEPFFQHHYPFVGFQRECTLAGGGPHCAFRFHRTDA